jgi:nucleotide-binding universal stress UspA family protein
MSSATTPISDEALIDETLAASLPAHLVIRRILVATDFSDAADGALKFAIDLARAFGATITLVHAYEIPLGGFPDDSFVASAETALQIADVVESALDGCAGRHRASGVPIETVLASDVPVHAIVDEALRSNADLIVLGTHARHGLAHALLGSVAEKVVRSATQPVLVWRPPR